MRIVSRKNIKKTNQALLEIENERVFRETAFVSLAIYKKEGEKYYLYPIPNRSFNSLDYEEEKGSVMKRLDSGVLKINDFLYTQSAKSNLSGTTNALVTIAFFDYDVFQIYKQFTNTTNVDNKYNPEKYKTNIATHHTDKFCIIIDKVV